MQPAGSRAATLTARVSQSVSRMGIRRTGQAVVQFIAEGAASEKTVDFPLSLTVTFHHNTAGHMYQTDSIIRLIDLLATFAAAVRTISTCAVFYKCS